MKVLGVNAVFHDPAAAVVVDGEIAAAAEEERFSRRKHGKLAVPFSTWELPESAARWCLERAGLVPAELDAVAYSYDPALAPKPNGDLTADEWEGLRTLYAREAPGFLETALPGLDPSKVRFVPHHVAHAASAHLASPFASSSVMVLDGRGEAASYLAGHYSAGKLQVLKTQDLPHSLGLRYEEVTAMASYGRPAFLNAFADAIRPTGDGGFVAERLDLERFAPGLSRGKEWTQAHADLASSMQTQLERVLVELASWLQRQTGERDLTLAGGVALNCVANSRLWRETSFERIWVQPAAGDAGTALGAALYVAAELGDSLKPMATAALGRDWTDAQLEEWLNRANIPYERPPSVAAAAADVLAADGVVAWFQGRSEYGPRALGHRSL